MFSLLLEAVLIVRQDSKLEVCEYSIDILKRVNLGIV